MVLKYEKVCLEIQLKRELIINGIGIKFKFENKNNKDFEFNKDKYFINISMQNNDRSY